MGLSRDRFSPGVKAKAVAAIVETKSFARASVVMEKVGEIAISSRHLGRMARSVGKQLMDRQHEQVAQLQQGTLPVEVENLPDLAVVEIDGGRIRTRRENRGTGTHDPCWRETKNALFQRMQSEVRETDPCPELPDSLQNRSRIRQLVLEFDGTADGLEAPPDDEPLLADSPRYEGPKRLVRTCVSSLDCSRDFGPLMAAEAHRRGFFSAPRQAFVGDGMKCNWTIWKLHFPDFVPIVDFLHAIGYLYRAAMAIGGDEDFGWGHCQEWVRDCWQGRVSEVIDEMSEWLAGQESLSEDDIPDDDPRRIVSKSLTYLTNNRGRMNYPEYRCQGLPLTSSLMESLVKEISWRVKGTEKFWNDPSGANPILALRAASLCEDSRLEKLLTQ